MFEENDYIYEHKAQKEKATATKLSRLVNFMLHLRRASQKNDRPKLHIDSQKKLKNIFQLVMS